MCNQAVGLIAAELERCGISTVCVVLLRSIAEAVRPPRALAVPFRHGYPLNAPNDSASQRGVVEAALGLLTMTGTAGPLLKDFA